MDSMTIKVLGSILLFWLKLYDIRNFSEESEWIVASVRVIFFYFLDPDDVMGPDFNLDKDRIIGVTPSSLKAGEWSNARSKFLSKLAPIYQKPVTQIA